MTIKVHKATHKIINKNGASLWLPSNIVGGRFNLNDPDPYRDGGDSSQLYPLGTKLEYADGRVWRYAKAGGTILGNSRLLIDGNYLPSASGQEDTMGFEGQIYAAYAAGVTTVEIEDGTDRVENYYEGGYFTVFHASGVKSATIRIAGSDAATSVDNVTLYLDEGLPWAVVEHDWCDAYRSPFSYVTQANTNGLESSVGLAHQAVTSAYFFWLQRSGPCWLAQFSAATAPGYTATYRDVYAHTDGTVRVGATAGVNQRVGYGLGRAVATTGDTYVWLQLE